MLVRQIHDSSLAQYAYLVGCPRTGDAIVFDPQRDIDRYLALAEAHGLRIVAAADTHVHADYLTGLREFAERGVLVYASDEGGEEWRYEWLRHSGYQHRLLRDGDRLHVGNIEFTVLHTPGHTPEHLAFTVTDLGGGATEPIAVITGDFVFVGDLGRPDLLEEAAGQSGTMAPAARQLYGSLARLRTLPDHVQVWPAHGAGSACGKALGDVPSSTVGYELRFNAAIRAATTEAHFVEYILAGQPEPPLYFARMKRDNREGPAVLGALPVPPHLPAARFLEEGTAEGAVIVDTRPRARFLARHVRGALLADRAFQFLTITGSYVREREALYLVIEQAQLDAAVRELVRIGLDDVRGWISPDELERALTTSALATALPCITMAELESRRHDTALQILDVRGKVDFDSTHIPCAMHIAHTRLLTRLHELPTDRPIVVHCQSGARSAHAAALLSRHGFAVTNVADHFAHWRPATPV